MSRRTSSRAARATRPLGAALLVSLSAAACGGVDRGRPTRLDEADAAPPAAACEAALGFDLEPVDGFEATFRPESWWIGAELTAACQTVRPTVLPRPGADCTQPSGNGRTIKETSEISGGRCGQSSRGLHVEARGLSEWGGNLTYSFAFDEDLAKWKDASGWEGIGFWARRGPDRPEGPVGRTLFVALGDRATDEKGGGCSAAATAPPSQKCDPFGAGVGLEEEWRWFSIRFDRMKQRGFGKPAAALDASKIRTIILSFDVGDWDFWIDDITFIRSNAP